MNDLRRILRSARPLPPRESLRGATLEKALAAWTDEPSREHWIDRLWTSRRLRLVWALSMLLLVLLDLLVTPDTVPGLSRRGLTLGEARLVFAGTTSPDQDRAKGRFGS